MTSVYRTLSLLATTKGVSRGAPFAWVECYSVAAKCRLNTLLPIYCCSLSPHLSDILKFMGVSRTAVVQVRHELAFQQHRIGLQHRGQHSWQLLWVDRSFMHHPLIISPLKMILNSAPTSHKHFKARLFFSSCTCCPPCERVHDPNVCDIFNCP